MDGNDELNDRYGWGKQLLGLLGVTWGLPGFTGMLGEGWAGYWIGFPSPPVRLRAQGISEVEVLTRSTAWLR